MHLLRTVKCVASFRPLIVRFLSVNAKSTQLETASMSNLKITKLSDLNDSAHQLFQKYVNTDEVKYLDDIFQSGGFEMVMLCLLCIF